MKFAQRVDYYSRRKYDNARESLDSDGILKDMGLEQQKKY